MADFAEDQKKKLIIPICKYALVIGVSDYKDSERIQRDDLPVAIKDSQEICKLLRALNYTMVLTNNPDGNANGKCDREFCDEAMEMFE